VAGLRQFTAKHGVALADAARRYGRLWRQGIPYTALMLNSINHPDARGMAIFADALMALFPETGRQAGLSVEPRPDSNTASLNVRSPLLPGDLFDLRTCEGVIVGGRDLGLFQVKLAPQATAGRPGWDVQGNVFRYAWRYAPGVTVAFEGTVGADGVGLSYRVENGTSEALERVQIHTCVPTTEAPSFFPAPRRVAVPGSRMAVPNYAELYDRLWLWSGAQAFPFRRSALAADQPHLAFTRAGVPRVEWGWWTNATETFDAPLIAATSHDGQHVLALTFEQAIWASSNVGDDRACFHLFPHFGRIEPGGSRTVRGRFLILAGDADAARRRLTDAQP